MSHPRHGRALFLILSFLLLPVVAHAAYGAGAISLQFNTSARDAGMGNTGVATVWGGDVNVWANPAMLAFRPGLRYGTMHSKLAEGFAENIYIDKKELTFGAYGVGLLFADGPIDHVHLDLGEQTGTGTQQTSVPGYAWTGDRYVYERDESGFFDEETWGYEVSLLNLLHIRRGHVSAPWGDIDGDTEGWQYRVDALALLSRNE